MVKIMQGSCRRTSEGVRLNTDESTGEHFRKSVIWPSGVRAGVRRPHFGGGAMGQWTARPDSRAFRMQSRTAGPYSYHM